MNKAKHFLTLFFIFPLYGLSQWDIDKNVTIKGEFSAPPDSTLMILFIPEKMSSSIFTPVVNGSFVFKTQISEPTIAYLRMQSPKKKENDHPSDLRYLVVRYDSLYDTDILTLYLEPGTITIKAKNLISTANVKGSPAHKDWEKLYKKTYPIETELGEEGISFLVKLKKNDTTGRTAYNNRFNLLNQQLRTIHASFINKHPNSYVSLYCVFQLAKNLPDYEQVNILLRRISPRLRRMAKVKQLQDELYKIKKDN